MKLQSDHTSNRYKKPTFSSPPDDLELARAAAVRSTAMIATVEDPHLALLDSGGSVHDLASRFEDVRLRLLARKLRKEPLSAEEEMILTAINDALRETMVMPPAESEQVKAAVETAEILLERLRRGSNSTL